MIFDVMVREKYNENGKPVISVKRIHDSELSAMVRYMQDTGVYIFAVIPLFRQRKEQVTIATGPEEVVEVEGVGRVEGVIGNKLIIRECADPNLIKKSMNPLGQDGY